MEETDKFISERYLEYKKLWL